MLVHLYSTCNHLCSVNPVPKPKCQVQYGCRYSCINLYTLSSATQSAMHFFILVSAFVLFLYCVVVVKPSLDFYSAVADNQIICTSSAHANVDNYGASERCGNRLHFNCRGMACYLFPA